MRGELYNFDKVFATFEINLILHTILKLSSCSFFFPQKSKNKNTRLDSFKKFIVARRFENKEMEGKSVIQKKPKFFSLFILCHKGTKFPQPKRSAECSHS